MRIHSVLIVLALGVGGFLAGCQASSSNSMVTAVDLGNTKCVVSGDPVGDSKLTEVYDGKIYHFCCPDCPAQFKKDPEKYAKLVAADPAKYGVQAH